MGILGGWFFTSNPDQNIPIVGVDIHEKWYIFNYDGKYYTAYMTHLSSSSYTVLVKKGTEGFYLNRKAAGDLAPAENTTIYIPQKNGNLIVNIPINTGPGGIVKNPQNLNGAVISTPTWNEIGSA